jgi:hypothetical protein
MKNIGNMKTYIVILFLACAYSLHAQNQVIDYRYARHCERSTGEMNKAFFGVDGASAVVLVKPPDPSPIVALGELVVFPHHKIHRVKHTNWRCACEA